MISTELCVCACVRACDQLFVLLGLFLRSLCSPSISWKHISQPNTFSGDDFFSSFFPSQRIQHVFSESRCCLQVFLVSSVSFVLEVNVLDFFVCLFVFFSHQFVWELHLNSGIFFWRKKMVLQLKFESTIFYASRLITHLHMPNAPQNMAIFVFYLLLYEYAAYAQMVQSKHKLTGLHWGFPNWLQMWRCSIWLCDEAVIVFTQNISVFVVETLIKKHSGGFFTKHRLFCCEDDYKWEKDNQRNFCWSLSAFS